MNAVDVYAHCIFMVKQLNLPPCENTGGSSVPAALEDRALFSPKFVPTLASSPSVITCFGRCIKDKTPVQRAKCSTKQPLPTQEVEQTNVRKSDRNDLQLEGQIQFISSIKNLHVDFKETARHQRRMHTNSCLKNVESKLYLEETLLLMKPQTLKRVPDSAEDSG